MLCTHNAWDWAGGVGRAKSAPVTLNVDAAPAGHQSNSGLDFKGNPSQTGGREIPKESWGLTVRCIHVQNMQRIIW